MDYATVDLALRAEHPELTIPALCREALGRIADGHRDLAAVLHPLGFLCLPVYRDADHGVCVHLWSASVPPTTPTTSAVHAHSWDLVSFVLYGWVGNTVLRVTDDPAAGTHRIFEVHSRGDIDEVCATPRRVRYRPVRHGSAGPGMVYRLPASRFHASTVEAGSEAATVVLGRTRSAVDLTLGPLDTPTHRVPRRRYSAQDTVEVVRMIDKALAARGTGVLR